MMGIVAIVVQAIIIIVAFRFASMLEAAALVGLMMVIQTTLAGLLLRYSKTDQVSWRNRIAGWLLPWSKWIGPESLKGLLFKNLIAGFLFGLLVAAADRWLLGSQTQTAPTSLDEASERRLAVVLFWLTFSCWFVLIGGWLLLLRSWSKSSSRRIAESWNDRDRRRPLVVPPLATMFSAVLWVVGAEAWALAVAGLPILIVITPMIVMLVVVAVYTLLGKKIRWN